MSRMINLTNTEYYFSLEQTIHDLEICIKRKYKWECEDCFHSKVCFGAGHTLRENSLKYLKELKEQNIQLNLRINELTDLVNTLQGGYNNA